MTGSVTLPTTHAYSSYKIPDSSKGYIQDQLKVLALDPVAEPMLAPSFLFTFWLYILDHHIK